MRTCSPARFAACLCCAAVLGSAPPILAQHWTQLIPTDAAEPPGRAQAAVIYDPVDYRIVLFGGRGDAGTFNDTWAFDLETFTWSELSTEVRPPRRFTPAGIYDPEQHRMVIWSGQGDSFYNDVWAFDLEAASWTELMPGTPAQPNTRYGVAAVYDPIAKDLVTFAGFTDQGRFDDTWRFDFDSESWSDVSRSLTPERRCLHGAVYDASRHRMLMYGGQRSGPLDDVWALDLHTDVWAEIVPATDRPAGRYFAATIYDAGNDRMLVFGGNRGSMGLSNELWALDGTSEAWELLDVSGTRPSAREGASAVYIESEDRVIVVGGRSSSYVSDVWSFDLASTGTSADVEEGPPAAVRLHPSYPNPFGAVTTISYELPREMRVDLVIFDVLGRELQTLVRGVHRSGSHTTSWNAAGAAPGTYVVELRADGFAQRRLVVLTD